MKKSILLVMAIMMLIGHPIFAQTSYVDIGSTRQTIRGFGGMNFPRWIDDLSASQVDKAFGTGNGQIGLSILRISIAPDQNQWNLEVPTAQRALNHGAIVFATPWSPPAYMKTNNNTTRGELRPDQYGAYANYLADFYSYMASNGVNLYAISVQNEPDWLPDYESCGWNGSQIRTFLDNNASVIPTRMIAPETVHYNADYMNAIASSSQVDILANHAYGGSPTRYNSSKEQWMTEHYAPNSDANSANRWPEALETAKEIHDYLVNGYNAYVWWYIRRSYGLITEDGNVSKRGYAMSHYSKYVRPGFNRVDATTTPTSGVSVSAYTDGNTLVIVAINQNSSSRNVTFNLSGGQVEEFTKYETTSSANFANRGIVSGGSSMSNSLSGYSIATYVGTVGSGPVGNTYVWLEAECGDAGSLWNVVDDGAASNDQYVTVQSGNNSTGSAPTSAAGYIDYDFSVDESGTYAVWSRVITPNGDDDSFWVRMDGGSWFQWNNIGPNSSWAWEQAQTYSLNPGNHTLTIAYREDGALLDKILITNTGTSPSGEGSAATNCSAPCDPTPIVPYISVNGAAFQQISSVTVNSGDQIELGPQPTTGGSWSWTGCGTTGTSREQTIYPTSSCTATATYTNSCGTQSTQSFSITVNPFNGSNIVWLEAECGTVGSLWNVSSDGNASNNEYVSIQPGNNSTGSAPGSASGQLSYTFNLSENGTYTLWARVIAPTANDDSYWIQMDGGSWLNWNNIAPASTTWTWDDVDSYSLSAGTHTLNIAYREDGTQLDKLYLSNTGGTPSGEGDAANNCGSGNYSITVRALGVDGSEQITLTVGGTAVQSWTLGTGMSDYSATTSLSGPIAIEFTNDDGTVRDVQIDYINVEGSVMQAEDQSTNTGVWQDGSCGGSYSEWLHCGGYIEFSAFKNAGAKTESIAQNEIVIFPNPATEILFIQLPGDTPENASLSLYDAKGSLIQNLTALNNENTIDLSGYEPGLYIVVFHDNSSGIITKRFIKK